MSQPRHPVSVGVLASVLAAALLLVSSDLDAEIMPPRGVADRVNTADVIVLGRAGEVRLYEPGNESFPRGEASFEVSEVLAGSVDEPVIRLTYGLFTCDVTDFVEGEEYLLFLVRQPEGYFLSWYDYAQYHAVKGGFQQVRREWYNRPPIPRADLLSSVGKAIASSPRFEAESETGAEDGDAGAEPDVSEADGSEEATAPDPPRFRDP